jgi:Predicted membrane protein (DUF2306)
VFAFWATLARRARKQPLDNEQMGGNPTSQQPAARFVTAGFWISILIAVAAVLRRIAALAFSKRSAAQVAGLDGAFASHAALTLAHIVPALAFVALVPMVFLRRKPAPRWAEQLLFPLGAIVGITAYAMSRYAVGGWVERSAVLLFNSLFLYWLWSAYSYRRRGERRLEREALVRSVAILLGIATTRPIMAVFFATSRITDLQPEQFFGIAFWLGFSINTLAVELWLRSGSRQQLDPVA